MWTQIVWWRAPAAVVLLGFAWVGLLACDGNGGDEPSPGTLGPVFPPTTGLPTAGISAGVGGMTPGGMAGMQAGAGAGQGGMVAGTGGTGGMVAGTGGTAGTGGMVAGTGGTGGMVAGTGGMGATGETGPSVGMTAAHNAIRASIDGGGSGPLPELTWDSELAAYAQEWADSSVVNNCGSLVHRPMSSPYGENLYGSNSGGASPPLSAPSAVVNGWASEDQCYTYGSFMLSDVCTEPCVSLYGGCGHYTQVVWRDSKRVGCGRATCQAGGRQHEIWVCNYDPPGNYLTQFPY